jgi:hypothetical protein
MEQAPALAEPVLPHRRVDGLSGSRHYVAPGRCSDPLCYHTPMRDPLPALDAFLHEHRDCDDLDAGMDAEHVWMACSCGAEMVHPLGRSGSPPLISTSPTARIVLPIIRTRAALTPSHRSRHNFPICTVGLRYSQGPPRI